VLVSTFHALGLIILRENPDAAGLTPSFRIAEESEQLAAVCAAAGVPFTERDGRRLLSNMDDGLRGGYAKRLPSPNPVSLDELLALPVPLLSESPTLARRYRARWQWIFVDEYQDVDPAQYELLRLLCPPGGNLCAIGDPDQAIYSFRGADVEFFLRFARDFS